MLRDHIDTHGHGGSGKSGNHAGVIDIDRMKVGGGERRIIKAGEDYSQPCDDHDGDADDDDLHVHMHLHEHQEISEVRRNSINVNTTTNNNNIFNTR